MAVEFRERQDLGWKPITWKPYNAKEGEFAPPVADVWQILKQGEQHKPTSDKRVLRNSELPDPILASRVVNELANKTIIGPKDPVPSFAQLLDRAREEQLALQQVENGIIPTINIDGVDITLDEKELDKVRTKGLQDQRTKNEAKAGWRRRVQAKKTTTATPRREIMKPLEALKEKDLFQRTYTPEPVVPLEDPPTNPHPPLPRRGEFRPFKHGPGNPLQDIALARSVPTAERRALVAEHYIKDLGRPVFPHVRSEPGKRKVSSNRYVEELQKTG